jgi:hypothetical protein
MDTRLKQYVESISYDDTDGKINFPFNHEHSFKANGNNHLIDLPLYGNVSLDCVVRCDTLEIDYKLLEATRDDNGLITAVYIFNSDKN